MMFGMKIGSSYGFRSLRLFRPVFRAIVADKLSLTVRYKKAVCNLLRVMRTPSQNSIAILCQTGT